VKIVACDVSNGCGEVVKRYDSAPPAEMKRGQHPVEGSFVKNV
jgi:hypothetical protein